MLVVMAFLGCKKENKDYNVRIALMNATPDGTGFDVWVGGQKLDATATYGLPGNYTPAPALTDTIRWKLSSRTAYDTSFLGDLPNGTDFTLLFYDSAQRYKSMLLRDRWQETASANKAYIRFFPMLVGGDSITVRRYLNDSTQINLSGVRRFADFNASPSAGHFAEVDSSGTKWWLYNKSEKLDSINRQQLVPGKAYTIYIIGVVGNTDSRKPRLVVYGHQ